MEGSVESLPASSYGSMLSVFTDEEQSEINSGRSKGVNMRYHVLGKTGLKVSELGFGCGSVGGLLVRGNQEEMTRTVRRAIDLGINYFDTASMYGNGKSESNLGTVLQKLNADVTIGTKVRLSNAELNDIDKAITESVDRSLKRLRLDCIDLIQLHNPVGLSRDPLQSRVGFDDLGAVIEAFQSLKEHRRVRFYGINGLGDSDALIQTVETTGAQTIQTCYNLLNPTAAYSLSRSFPFQDFKRLIPRAQAKEMGIIAIRVLAGGALSGDERRHPNAAKSVSPIATGTSYSDDVARGKRFQFLVDEGYVTSLAEAAIRFATSNPYISTALIGISSIEQLEQAVEYASKGALAPNVLQEIENVQNQ